MSGYIKYEAFLFLLAVETGAFLFLIYEVLRVLRELIPHHPAVTACEDIGYWTAAGIFLFSVIYRCNQGIIRCFFFLGCIFGAWLCSITFAPPLKKAWRHAGNSCEFCKIFNKEVAIFHQRCNIFVCYLRNRQERTKRKEA